MAKTCANGCRYGVFSKGLCKSCWNRQYGKPIKKNPDARPLKRTQLKKATKPIKKASKKRQEQLNKYYPLREKFLKERNLCELKVDDKCTVIATEVHHEIGKENELLLEVKFWKAGCRHCHHIITEKSKEAIENGQSISRHKIRE